MCVRASRCQSNLGIRTTRHVLQLKSRMTLEKLLSQVGIGTKQLTERYSEYGAPMQDHHVYYAYEPEPPLQGHVASSKHNYGSSHKSNASMSALTLLAFLFFLHILQQCIKDHMTDMSATPVMIMTAGREGEEAVSKTVTNKVDKTGITQSDSIDSDSDSEINQNDLKKGEIEIGYDAKNPFQYEDQTDNSMLMKINTAEYTPVVDKNKYKTVIKTFANRNSFPGYVSAMDEE